MHKSGCNASRCGWENSQLLGPACGNESVIEESLANSTWAFDHEAAMNMGIERVSLHLAHCGHDLIICFALMWAHSWDITIYYGLPIAMPSLYAVISYVAASNGHTLDDGENMLFLLFHLLMIVIQRRVKPNCLA